MHFVNCYRIPRHFKLLIFDLLGPFGFHGQIAKTLYCSKSLQKQANLRKPQQNLWNQLQILRNPKKIAESKNNY